MKTQFVLPSVQSYWRYSAAGFSAVAGIIHAYFMSEPVSYTHLTLPTN
jgi:hypothetical protein